jgi:hypothetical protein
MIALCPNVSHKQKNCSGATKSHLWQCSIHRKSTNNEPCEWCNNSFTSRQKPIQCREVGCKTRCHTVKRCSGISRYVTDPIWKCEQHGGRKRPQRVVDGAEMKPKCASSSCKSALKKNVNGNYSCITCESCNKKFHKKCTKLSRDVQEKVINGEDSWTCQKCELTLIAICSQGRGPDPVNPGIGKRKVEQNENHQEGLPEDSPVEL